MTDQDPLAALRAENARLTALLESRGIDWRAQELELSEATTPELDPSRFTPAEKVALFRRLFQGRNDVYPLRWESKSSGRSGYSPACGNEWRAVPVGMRLPGPMPESLTVTLSNLVYFEKAQMPQPLANRLIRLAAFQNPAFYQAQAMRFSVWDKPRVIGCAENYPNHIALPRGCLEPAQDLLRDNDIKCDLRDERFAGEPIHVTFTGTLRLDQEAAVAAMFHFDAGVLCAPTAFGKTVMAAAMIARRGVNALILVHRTELLKQWQERLQAFLSVGKDVVGLLAAVRPNQPAISTSP